MNIFKKIYRRVTNKFNILTIIIGCFTLFFGISYSYFIITTEEYDATEMYMGRVLYSYNIYKAENNNTLTNLGTNSITVPANTTNIVYVEITNLSPVKTKYKLQYSTATCNTANCQVKVSDASSWDVKGILKASGSTLTLSNGTTIFSDKKRIKIAIINNTNSSTTVTITGVGGYAYNNYASTTATAFNEDEKYVDSSENIYLNTIAMKNLSCIPTSTIPCMYGGESARNYVKYNNVVYRMLGVYGTSAATSYVKMIKSENLLQTSYTNAVKANGELKTYYDTLSPTGYLASDFFTPTTISGVQTGASLVSTDEYMTTGYDESFIIKGSANETLTGTTNGANINYIKTDGTLATKAQSENSYIKPVLTLQDDAYINYGGTGSSSNPYIISNKVDLIITKIIIDGELATATPITGTYKLTADCENGSAVWDNSTHSINISMSDVPAICQLNFESNPTLYNLIASANTDLTPMDDTSVVFPQGTSGVKASYCNSDGVCYPYWDLGSSPIIVDPTNGLYYTADATNYGENGRRIYYYRGDIENNWVLFAGHYWRILRTTWEYGTKLVYSGPQNGLSDKSAVIGPYIYQPLPTAPTIATEFYHGYTYNQNWSTVTSWTAAGTQLDSNMKTQIDTWYENNIGVQYRTYLSENTIFCNDRTWKPVEDDGDDYIRYKSNDATQNLGFNCTNENNQRYTVSTTVGNGYLDYPIALLNRYEVGASGLAICPRAAICPETATLKAYIMDNSKLATNEYIQLMSLNSYTKSNGWGAQLHIYPTGNIYGAYSNHNTSGEYARPVIGLKSCIKTVGGGGTQDNPYILSNTGC